MQTLFYEFIVPAIQFSSAWSLQNMQNVSR